MDPLTLTLAAGAYVAAGLAKKSADSVIGGAYNKIVSYLSVKLGWSTPVKDLDEGTIRRSGLGGDTNLIKFGEEVLARTPVLRRANLVSKALQSARILWVDDVPENNRSEYRLLVTFGAEVRQVRSTREAFAALADGPWDLLLSDMARDGVQDAGVQMLRQLPLGTPPVVFYVGRVDESRPVPVRAFGMADRPEPFLHLVLDVLERRRL